MEASFSLACGRRWLSAGSGEARGPLGKRVQQGRGPARAQAARVLKRRIRQRWREQIWGQGQDRVSKRRKSLGQRLAIEGEKEGGLIMGNNAESVARRVLEEHREEVERISLDLASSINDLKQMDTQGWRHEGRDLVNWMYAEAKDMADAERDVAISKTAGGSAAIAGGLLTGAGIVASFSTFGLAAPLALGGLALSASGAATSAGGDIAKLSIVHMKACQIRERCERFEQRTEGVLIILLKMRQLMTELSTLCRLKNSPNKDVIEIVLRSAKSATNLVKAGTDLYKMGAIVYDITTLQRTGVIFGEDFLKLAAGSITGSGLAVSKAMFKTAGAAVGIGFGIWDVLDGAGTLRNGGSHTVLIRDNASQVNDTIKEIDKALRKLDVLTCACCV